MVPAQPDEQQRFVSDIAHDLRTPLSAMVLQAQVLTERLPTMNSDARSAAERLIASVGGMHTMVEELLELGTLDGHDTHLEPLDVRGSVRAVLAQLPIDAEPNLDCCDGLFVLADRRRLRRVLANLLTNAVTHGNAAEVEVRARRCGDAVVIDVLDRGPGFPDGALDRAFDRCFRAGSTGGTGLGLAIARGHAEAQDGTITAENRRHGGAKVRLTLAAAPGSVPPPIGAAEASTGREQLP